MTDAELVRRVRDGQPAAREELVRRWSPRVLADCRARVRHADAAEDLAQETLLRGLSRLDSLNDPEKLGAWLRGIAVRVCLDWINSRAAGRAQLTELSHRLNNATDSAHADALQAERNEERERLRSEIDELPEELREVVLLHYYDNATYQDIADFLGVSRATVNARLAKARAQLARRLAIMTR